MTDILDLIRNNATKAVSLRKAGEIRRAELYEARVTQLINRATAQGHGEAAQAVEQSVYDEALGDEEDSGVMSNPVVCNPPISPHDAAAIEHVLNEHGYRNPGARPGENEISTIKITKPIRKNPKQANAWKKRFKSREAMERYMRKLRKMAEAKQEAIDRRMARLRAKARLARMKSR